MPSLTVTAADLVSDTRRIGGAKFTLEGYPKVSASGDSVLGSITPLTVGVLDGDGTVVIEDVRTSPTGSWLVFSLPDLGMEWAFTMPAADATLGARHRLWASVGTTVPIEVVVLIEHVGDSLKITYQDGREVIVPLGEAAEVSEGIAAALQSPSGVIHRAIQNAINNDVPGKITDALRTGGAIQVAIGAAELGATTALAGEASTRQSADTALGQRIDNEASARKSADDALSTRITTNAGDISSLDTRTKEATEDKRGLIEIATRLEATAGTDNTRALTPAGGKALADNRFNTLWPDAIDTELAAGGKIRTDIDGVKTGLETRIATEEDARASQDTTLGTRIDDEASARQSADTALGQRIDNIPSAGTTPTASETVEGKVELATAAEIQAGTSGVIVPTAARLKAELDRRGGGATEATVYPLVKGILEAGDNVTITADDTNRDLTIASTGGGSSGGTGSSRGRLLATTGVLPTAAVAAQSRIDTSWTVNQSGISGLVASPGLWGNDYLGVPLKPWVTNLIGYWMVVEVGGSEVSAELMVFGGSSTSPDTDGRTRASTTVRASGAALFDIWFEHGTSGSYQHDTLSLWGQADALPSNTRLKVYEALAGGGATGPRGPAGPTPPPASETVAGIVELATADEAVAGTDGTKAMSPLRTRAVIDAIPDASEDARGWIEVASQTEVTAGTASALAVSPLTLKKELDRRAPSQSNVYDPVKAIIRAGSNVTITADDASDELVIASTGGGGGTTPTAGNIRGPLVASCTAAVPPTGDATISDWTMASAAQRQAEYGPESNLFLRRTRIAGLEDRIGYLFVADVGGTEQSEVLHTLGRIGTSLRVGAQITYTRDDGATQEADVELSVDSSDESEGDGRWDAVKIDPTPAQRDAEWRQTTVTIKVYRAVVKGSKGDKGDPGTGGNPTQISVYDPVKSILQAGTDITISADDTDHQLTITVDESNFRRATDTRRGIAQLATTAEVTAGTNDQDIITPAKLAAEFTRRGAGGVPDATETVKGRVELATTAEVTAGSGGALAVNPARLKPYVDKITELETKLAAVSTLAEMDEIDFYYWVPYQAGPGERTQSGTLTQSWIQAPYANNDSPPNWARQGVRFRRNDYPLIVDQVDGRYNSSGNIGTWSDAPGSVTLASQIRSNLPSAARDDRLVWIRLFVQTRSQSTVGFDSNGATFTAAIDLVRNTWWSRWPMDLDVFTELSGSSNRRWLQVRYRYYTTLPTTTSYFVDSFTMYTSPTLATQYRKKLVNALSAGRNIKLVFSGWPHPTNTSYWPNPNYPKPGSSAVAPSLYSLDVTRVDPITTPPGSEGNSGLRTLVIHLDPPSVNIQSGFIVDPEKPMKLAWRKLGS